MAEVTIESDVRYARDLFGRFASAMDAAAIGALNEILDEGQTEAQAFAPDGPPRDDYGRRPKLISNIQKILLDSRSGIITIDAVNALSQETGAVAHPIDAVNAENLVFYWEREGKWFKGPHVDHPGNPPQPFMEAGFEEMDRIAEGVLEKWYGGI